MLVQQDPKIHVTVFCSIPRRYGIRSKNTISQPINSRVFVQRFWIPFLGQGPLASVISYLFYFLQVIPAAILLRPHIIVGTSAKLLTSFVAACASRLTGAPLYVDFRDTFADNFFYFYRWHKRILFQSIIMLIENIVLRSAHSINMVSIGFKDAFVGWDRILSKYSISLTNYPNGIHSSTRIAIENASNNCRTDDNMYHIVYAGNLGEGQDILGLLVDLKRRPDVIETLVNQSVVFDIYGSGAQSKPIEDLLKIDLSSSNHVHINQLVRYHGFLPQDQIYKIYACADCLMLQLGLYNSLSMVIPTKIFEYSATNCPILYGASGFTSQFIANIDSTIRFDQCSAESFSRAIEDSRHIKVDSNSRRLYLNSYDTDSIYAAYARHILTGVK